MLDQVGAPELAMECWIGGAGRPRGHSSESCKASTVRHGIACFGEGPPEFTHG